MVDLKIFSSLNRTCMSSALDICNHAFTPGRGGGGGGNSRGNEHMVYQKAHKFDLYNIPQIIMV